MLTEKISPRYVELDSWSSGEMLAAMYESQLAAAAAVRGALENVAINLESITDAAYVKAMRARVAELEARLSTVAVPTA